MNQPLFRGSATALITPFENGRVDVSALRRLVDMQIEGGTAAIVSCGTTGEPATMTAAEREMVIRETVKAVNGRIPVICGTGSNNTAAVVENERRYRDLGCAAQLVVTPYYNKTTQEGPADEWIRKWWYIYTMEYYSAVKKNSFESVLMR